MLWLIRGLGKPMSKKPTPPPESRFIGFGAVVALLWAATFVLLSVGFGYWWLMVFALPSALYLIYLLQALVLLVAAWWRWHGTSVRGILVLSDSPNWKPYIEEHWLPRLKAKNVVLNWSERSEWRSSLPVWIVRRFGTADDNFNFNPMLILFRGLRYPFVCRYCFAFSDARHGNMDALHRLEEHMFT